MNRSVLVTGGNRGIGQAVARAFHAAGDRVAVTYRDAVPDGPALAVPCDVTDTASVDKAFTLAEERHGPIEVLVANAGVTRDRLVALMDDDDFSTVVDTNLTGAFRCARRALPGMVEMRRGRLIFISSAVAAIGGAGQANYTAAKAGLTGFARSLAWELGSRAITANVVAPGLIETRMSTSLPRERTDGVLRSCPLGRPGTAAEVAAAVLFLAAPDAGYITGAVLPVAGGFAMGT
ncbi:3-oxoacyl-ACP reductase FabG [Actinoplanes sp. N902-109]|uniref:3-oxoacyl-ACP reductase FabG n=1 Tax=Actinoplanes sp. (strain N902-109) TaxID=649831 RepID=UPI0003294A4A|nr:3-oxoacyl-ACP reductase FabG [Actinoplanes sp. N902-109]AGL13745.1 3-oxoacyl-(acyl carrier protein) synthase [Actinoplanes sp. N902-109]